MMNTRKIFLMVIIASLVSAITTVIAFKALDKNQQQIVATLQPATLTNFINNATSDPVDLTVAAESTVHAVVHVKTETKSQAMGRNPLYEFFYGQSYGEPQPVVGFGSGVIITGDGFIVTNNHVIKDSESIKVALNDNREFDATLIGADPSTDIAVIKIDEKDLPFIPFGNSDNLKLGEWVLAVGNPFNLTSTVTAGIVSAKGRNLGILQDQYRIESFIQTDAALNPGNSGGALVNTHGELVGINTAIISPSGGYAGNSFAIPVSIVRKVVEDLIQYGEVQRAFLGVSIRTVDATLAKEIKLDRIQGVYVDGLSDGGAAAETGIEKGDVILSVNNALVNSTAELQEQVGRYRPGEKISLTINRSNKKKQFEVVLRNRDGDTKIVKPEEIESILGAKFATPSADVLKKFNLDGGVQIIDIGDGKLQNAGIKKGFIITQVNNKPVATVNDIKRNLQQIKGGVYIEGIYPNGVVTYYAFGM